MAERKKRIIEKCLGKIKTIIFEKGNLIYLINIPFFRRSQRKIESHLQKEKINIGFMIQCPEDWAVLESVYQTAQADEQIEPVVLLIPEMEFAFYIKLKKILWEKVYSFGQLKFGNQAIQTYDPDTDKWVDPIKLNLDYVFIPRPYETYLPKSYRARHLRRITKVCYVPYAFPTLSDWQILYNSHFIRNVTLIFCEKKSSEKYIRDKFALTINKGDQKCYLCGYPKFDLIQCHDGKDSSLWPRERQNEVFRVMWTPRWTTDPNLGGSNFFKYKDQMISWAERDRSIDMLFRPHPMALAHYVSAGLITQEEEEEYLKKYQQCENANVDRTTDYFDTFFSSDVLVTDISSMIMDYLFTEKPIIYCKSPEDANIAVPELHDCLYKVESFNEIIEKVNQLKLGKDPKKELRKELLHQVKPDGMAADNIIYEIKKDYFCE